MTVNQIVSCNVKMIIKNKKIKYDNSNNTVDYFFIQ